MPVGPEQPARRADRDLVRSFIEPAGTEDGPAGLSLDQAGDIVAVEAPALAPQQARAARRGEDEPSVQCRPDGPAAARASDLHRRRRDGAGDQSTE